MTVPFCFGLRISLRSNSAFSIFLQFIGKHLQRPQRSKPQSFPSQTIQFASNNFWRSKLNTTREFEWKVFCNWNVAVFMFHFIDLFDSRAKSWAQNYSLGVYIIRILLVLCFRPQTILYNVFKFSATSNLLNTCRLQVATPNSRRDCAHTNSRLAFLGPACTASEMKASALARPISISSPGGGFDKIYSSKNLWITINQKPIIYRTQNSGFNLFSSLSRFFFRFSFAAPVFILC